MILCYIVDQYVKIISNFFSETTFRIYVLSYKVDSSFLDAIPAELREELRQDFEHKKQAEASRSAASGTKNKDTFLVPVMQAPVKKGKIFTFQNMI